MVSRIVKPMLWRCSRAYSKPWAIDMPASPAMGRMRSTPLSTVQGRYDLRKGGTMFKCQNPWLPLRRKEPRGVMVSRQRRAINGLRDQRICRGVNPRRILTDGNETFSSLLTHSVIPTATERERDSNQGV